MEIEKIYYNEKEANAMWDKIMAFSSYGFNLSHSFAYSMISYYSQWFKVNYPLEFWTSSLQHAKDDLIPNRISEIKKLKQGIKLSPPDINYSKDYFECNTETQSIYWSISKIKGLGEANSTYIMEERVGKGFFTGYDDFVKRIPKKQVNKKTVLSLILAGAFDDIEKVDKPEDRLFLVQRHYRRIGEALPEEYKDIKNTAKQYFWIFKQRELTGFGDVNFLEFLKQDKKYKKFADLYVNYETFIKAKDYEECCVCGRVSFIKERNTKNGKMLVVELLNNNDVISIVIWNDMYEEYFEILKDCMDKLLAITGKIRYDAKYKKINQLYSTDETLICEI